ncbi:Hypothetical protein POVR1_LOCUS75 [uncultured virus]|nr:Hypothetical protein POVR1_LOCUS75 [uncultured virus]
MNPVIQAAEIHLQTLLVDRDVAGHGFGHMKTVADHAMKALEVETISPSEKLAVSLAALLHDADDEKIFPGSVDNENARKILTTIGAADVELIVEMINLVSCSKNGDTDPPKPFMAIPRDCDKAELIGVNSWRN